MKFGRRRGIAGVICAVTALAAAADQRTQRWQLTPHKGALTLTNAVSQLVLTAGGADGAAVQAAPDTTAPTRVRAVPRD
ncbi:hypothetical protein ACIQFU_09495 [Streptomyces sp. NPDC093065]|uniref:hypothetical protein n=1 Tax=Streptomyces sp. NPDC093065 TaxID=3366021 RepID=UPI00381CA4D4